MVGWAFSLTLSQTEQSCYVIAELLGEDGIEPGPETRNC